MGSYENIVKIEEIRRRFDEGDLITAQKVLDTMELKKLKNLTDLNLIAEVYAANERYEEAADIYRKIYEKVKTRKSLFQLIEVLIRLNNTSEVEEYLQLYQKLAPRDFYNYIFRYKIDKIKGESFEHLIEILETLKKEEYTEKWSYELAKLYYKAGMEKECIRECSDIELWFGEGTYVEKAKILKSYYSGEANKDKIMEEIKRRAEVINHKDESTYIDQANLENSQVINETADYHYMKEDESYPQTVSILEETVVDVTDVLKQELNEMMLDEPAYSVSQEMEAETTYLDGSGALTEEQRSFSKQEDGDSELWSKEQTSFSGQEDDYDSWTEEQETSQDIYRPTEADSRLQQLVLEYQINIQDIFGNFLQVATMKQQLVHLLEDVLHHGVDCSMLLITGAKGSGKTTMAKDMALFFFQTGILKSSRIAKIKAEKLNGIHLKSKRETLKDCCMVIENASQLSSNTRDQLLELLQLMHGELVVILEDETSNLDSVSEESNKWVDMIVNKIHIPEYTSEDYINFAFAALQQRNYNIHPNAEQRLVDKINQIVNQSEQETRLGQIYDLMQTAMKAADIRLGRQLSNLASRGNITDLEILTLQEEDLM